MSADKVEILDDENMDAIIETVIDSLFFHRGLSPEQLAAVEVIYVIENENNVLSVEGGNYENFANSEFAKNEPDLLEAAEEARPLLDATNVIVVAIDITNDACVTLVERPVTPSNTSTTRSATGPDRSLN